MELPYVSIIIPTYNYGHFIKEAITSVLKQEYPIDKIEIIVVDDGSTDNTKEVLNSFIHEGILSYYYQENKGKANATFNAIKKSKGKYIFNLDADDYFFPNKISSSVQIFEGDEAIVHVASPARIFNDKERSFKMDEDLPSDIVEKALDGTCLLHRFYDNNMLFGGGSTYAARSSVLTTINIPTGVDMYIDEFLILAVLPYGKSYFIKQPLSIWRAHGNNYSVSSIKKENASGKSQRLLNSSAAVLSYIENNNFDSKIIRIYSLKDLTRRIAYKENVDKKKMIDIIKYAYRVFIILRPEFKQVMKYHVIHRLIPTRIFRFLKYECRMKKLYS